jgi:hypothetical protein
MIKARVRNRQIEFNSRIAQERFLAVAEGKNLLIQFDDKPSGQMRRYFEGAMVPAVYYQHPFSGWETFKDAREALKFEFLPSYTKNFKGERIRYARSTMTLSKQGFKRFLDMVTDWMLENGLEVPVPDEYKAWSDSAPGPGEIFPHVERMKKRYDELREANPATAKDSTQEEQ